MTPDSGDSGETTVVGLCVCQKPETIAVIRRHDMDASNNNFWWRSIETMMMVAVV